MNTPRVALIQMPFAMTFYPSLGLSLLKGQLERRNIKSDVIYLNMVFEKKLGHQKYMKISRGGAATTDLIGEWVFGSTKDEQQYIATYSNLFHEKHANSGKLKLYEAAAELLEIAKEMRSNVPDFIDNCFVGHNWGQYKIVGFTTVFEQTNACLQLARRIKAAFPAIKIIFGGANCEGSMGKTLIENYPFIDAVCTGEGDVAFPQYVLNVIDNRQVVIDGIIARNAESSLQEDSIVVPQALAQAYVLETSPYPFYDDYFQQYDKFVEENSPAPRIMFETSRGCWWGQKNHCTFCGLNGSSMGFRQKSGARAIEEVQHLLKKYGNKTKKFFATDNIIPMSYFKDFLPELRKLSLEIEIFYETKANLKKDQLRMYREAGLDTIQPGIESLDTNVLKLMKKGISSLQNVQVLKWCKEFNITPYWNYLVGFPGEDEASYEAQAELASKLVHFMPPGPVSVIRFDRFSPYFMSPAKFGLSNVSPYPSYRIVFEDVPQASLMDLAYFFEADYSNKIRVSNYTKSLSDALGAWSDNADSVTLTHILNDGEMLIFDCRDRASNLTFRLDELSSFIFIACDEATSLESVQREVDGNFGPDAIPYVEKLLELLCRRRLMVAEDNRFLTISIPFDSSYEPSKAVRARLASMMDDNQNIDFNSVIDIRADSIVFPPPLHEALEDISVAE